MTVGVYVHSLEPHLIRFNERFGIYWYGFAYLMAFVAGYWLLRVLARRGYGELKENQVGDFIAGAAIFGVLLGGRLGYALFYNLQEVLNDPLSLFRIWEGGMASHGGMLGMLIYTWVYARKHHISWSGLGDNLVVVASLGIFFGRLANFINGELYGRITSVAWGMKFPKELYDLPPSVQNEAVRSAIEINPAWHSIPVILDVSPHQPALRAALEPLLNARHPSQLYAAFLEGFLLFVMLWLVRTRCKVRNGVLTGLFFIGYALVRIVDECFREPDAALTLGLTRGQFLSLFLGLIGLGFLLHAFRGKAHPITQSIDK